VEDCAFEESLSGWYQARTKAKEKEFSKDLRKDGVSGRRGEEEGKGKKVRERRGKAELKVAMPAAGLDLVWEAKLVSLPLLADMNLGTKGQEGLPHQAR
jgi:hypothetical protein